MSIKPYAFKVKKAHFFSQYALKTILKYHHAGQHGNYKIKSGKMLDLLIRIQYDQG